MTTLTPLEHWRQTVAGITMMVFGVASLSINDALAKALAENYSAVQIMFLRNVIALPFAVFLALRMGGRAALRSHRPSPTSCARSCGYRRPFASSPA